jgi:hypothetical protein
MAQRGQALAAMEFPHESKHLDNHDRVRNVHTGDSWFVTAVSKHYIRRHIIDVWDNV